MKLFLEISGAIAWIICFAFLWFRFVPYEAARTFIREAWRRTYLSQWYEWRKFMKVYDETEFRSDILLRLRRFFRHWKRFRTNVYREKYQAILDWEAAKYEYEYLFIKGEEPNLTDFII